MVQLKIQHHLNFQELNMNRTLKRPMFRMGGAAEGITSGLDKPRQQYNML